MPRLLIVTPAHLARCDHLAAAGESVAGVAGAMAARGVEVAWSVCVDGTGETAPALSVDALCARPSLLFGTDVPQVELHLSGLEGRWGPSVARNVAFAATGSDWVFPLDADDLLVADGVAAMCDELASGAAWVASSRTELDGRECRSVVPERHGYAAGEVNAAYLHPFAFHPNNVSYRADVLAGAGGWPATPGGEDLALMLRVARDHAGVAVPEVSVAYRRWDAQTITTSAFRSARAARYTVYDRLDLLAGRDPGEMRSQGPEPGR